MTNREHLERWFHELWDKRNGAIIDEMVAPDCVIHGLPSAQHGPSGFKPFYALFGSAFESVAIQIDESLESGDRVAFRCTVRLVGRDGRRHDLTGGGIVRFRDGRMVEAWNQWDFLGLLASMGHVAETAFVEAMQTQARAQRPREG